MKRKRDEGILTRASIERGSALDASVTIPILPQTNENERYTLMKIVDVIFLSTATSVQLLRVTPLKPAALGISYLYSKAPVGQIHYSFKL